jgi:hypothetical protein
VTRIPPLALLPLRKATGMDGKLDAETSANFFDRVPYPPER